MNTDLKSLLPRERLVEGVYHLTTPDDSEKVYLKVRETEGRIYPDDTVRNLPDIDAAHPLHAEWMIRKSSLEKFEGYLKGRSITLLDVGCGNGWMSSRLARMHGCSRGRAALAVGLPAAALILALLLVVMLAEPLPTQG